MDLLWLFLLLYLICMTSATQALHLFITCSCCCVFFSGSFQYIHTGRMEVMGFVGVCVFPDFLKTSRRSQLRPEDNRSAVRIRNHSVCGSQHTSLCLFSNLVLLITDNKCSAGYSHISVISALPHIHTVISFVAPS